LNAYEFVEAASTYNGPPLKELLKVRSNKFLLFQTSGGFNNQRIILQRALRMCQITQRICIIPMAARHSSMYSTYNKLSVEIDLWDMSKVVDFPQLAKYSKIVPLTIPFVQAVKLLQSKIKSTKSWFVLEYTTPTRITTATYLESLNKRPERILSLAGSTVWKCFGKPSIANEWIEPVHPYFKYSPFFRSFAGEAVKALFGVKPFLAIHSRQQDHGDKWISEHAKMKDDSIVVAGDATMHSESFSTKFMPNDIWLTDDPGYLLKKTIAQVSSKHDIPVLGVDLYIATKPSSKNAQIYANLTDTYSLYFSQDIPAVLLGKFDSYFTVEQARLRNDMLGVIEQLICAHAYLYVGFMTSTFSKYIATLRSLPYSHIESTSVS